MLFVLSLLQRVQRHQVYVLLALAATSIIGGGIAFAIVEHVSVDTGLYWAITTAATVGYGDVSPHDSPGRIIAAAEMLTAIPSSRATDGTMAWFP